jgi:hypothetical protein
MKSPALAMPSAIPPIHAPAYVAILDLSGSRGEHAVGCGAGLLGTLFHQRLHLPVRKRVLNSRAGFPLRGKGIPLIPLARQTPREYCHSGVAKSVSGPILAWQYAGAGRIDCSQINPDIDAEAQLLAFLVMPPGAMTALTIDGFPQIRGNLARRKRLIAKWPEVKYSI